MRYFKIVFISATIVLSSVSSVYSEETKFVKDLREKIKMILQEYEDLFLKKVIVKPDNDKNEKHDKKDCPCGGDGVITHGDRHTTPCPCEICDCKKKKGEEPPKKVEVIASKPTIIMLSQKPCAPCKLWKVQKMKPLQDAGWDVQVLELDTEEGARIATAMGLSTTTTPKFYVTINNKLYQKQGILEYSDLNKYKTDAFAK